MFTIMIEYFKKLNKFHKIYVFLKLCNKNKLLT